MPFRSILNGMSFAEHVGLEGLEPSTLHLKGACSAS